MGCKKKQNLDVTNNVLDLKDCCLSMLKNDSPESVGEIFDALISFIIQMGTKCNNDLETILRSCFSLLAQKYDVLGLQLVEKCSCPVTNKTIDSGYWVEVGSGHTTLEFFVGHGGADAIARGNGHLAFNDVFVYVVRFACKTFALKGREVKQLIGLYDPRVLEDQLRNGPRRLEIEGLQKVKFVFFEEDTTPREIIWAD